jgi:methylmalonyl-CoA mutase N-terminal domain/subunit
LRNSKKEIKEALKKWEDDVLNPRVKKFKLAKSPTSFYTPLSSSNGSHFLEKVGFPGEFPYTAGNSPFEFWRAYAEFGAKLNYRSDGGGTGRSGKYGGFGTPADFETIS